MNRPPPRPTLFPYTTLFRSVERTEVSRQQGSRRCEEGIAVGRQPYQPRRAIQQPAPEFVLQPLDLEAEDRKSTRLNSSHVRISYAVFCLKKKKKNAQNQHRN